jgi:hypothetical protein
MKTLVYAFALSVLAGCSGSGAASMTPAVDAGSTPVDSGAGPADTGATPAETYPAGPYGSSVGRLFRPFTLTACNREGDEAQWRFDGPEFFTSQLTVISIAAAWCVPCQRETAQIEARSS